MSGPPILPGPPSHVDPVEVHEPVDMRDFRSLRNDLADMNVKVDQVLANTEFMVHAVRSTAEQVAAHSLAFARAGMRVTPRNRWTVAAQWAGALVLVAVVSFLSSCAGQRIGATQTPTEETR